MSAALIWIMLFFIARYALQVKFISVLYLMLFLVLYKCFTLREAIDHLHCLIMSFFMFLACSIISTSVTYVAFLFLFIILMMLDMVCLTIAREGGRIIAGFGTGHSDRIAGAKANLPVWHRLFISSLLVGVVILAMTIGLFLALPHYTATRISNPWIRPQENKTRASGFSDDINFVNLNNIKLDNTEVMRVYPSWEDGARRQFPASLRLRGQALDKYTEKSWTTFNRGRTKDSTSWDIIPFKSFRPAGRPCSGRLLIKTSSSFTISLALRCLLFFTWIPRVTKEGLSHFAHWRVTRILIC